MKLVEGKNSRLCGECKELKGFNKFAKSKNDKYGVTTTCKDCRKLYYERRKDKSKYFHKTQRNIEIFRDKLLQSKFCSKCDEYKSFNSFHSSKKGKYSLKAKCKLCCKEESRLRNERLSFSNFIKTSIKRNGHIFRDKLKKSKFCADCGKYKSFKRFHKCNITELGYKSYCKKCRSKRSEEYQKTLDREKLNKRSREYKRHKRKTDLTYRISVNIRTRIVSVLKGETKKSYTLDLIGCSFEEFRKYIEDQFEEGMTWDNYGFYGWHIDHIIPVSNWDLTCPYQQSVAFHHTNTQPMWATENKKKHTKIPDFGIDIDKDYINKYIKRQFKQIITKL